MWFLNGGRESPALPTWPEAFFVLEASASFFWT